MTDARKATSTEVAGRMQYLNPMAVSLPAPDRVNGVDRRTFPGRCRQACIDGEPWAFPGENCAFRGNAAAVRRLPKEEQRCPTYKPSGSTMTARRPTTRVCRWWFIAPP